MYKEREARKMQTVMVLEDCTRCGNPIRPGEPAKQAASVDIVGGRAVSSPVRSHHIGLGCYEAAKRRENQGIAPCLKA